MKRTLCISLFVALPILLTAQTAVTLSTTPNPAAFGSPVTLTAAVAPSGATGNVTFYDGVTLLGTRPLTAGSAVLSTSLLPAGPRRLHAFYTGDATHPAATSNVANQTIQSAPGGAFVPQTPFPVQPLSSYTAVADFNKDGRPDVALTRYHGAAGAVVTVFLGNPDATFQAIDTPVSSISGPIVAADFNGDGNPDLAFSSPSASFYLMLGNGDGTFRAPVSYGPGSDSLLAADFNGDGKPDVLTFKTMLVFLPVPPEDGSLQPHEGGPVQVTTLTFWPGSGDGTFGLSKSSNGSPASVIADFNGDLKPDLATLSAVRLGIGDGTFQTVAYSLNFAVGNATFVAADFNGDGKTDLALGGVTSQVVHGVATTTAATWIYLGNGDGSLQNPVFYPLGAAVNSSDFNGDGAVDLILTDTSGNTSGVLLGQGDGSFQQLIPVASGILLAVADFNQDGRPDLLTVSTVTGALTVLLGAVPATPPGLPASILVTGGASQTASTGATFPVPLQVTVRDAAGVPLSGIAVTFTAPSGNASAALSSTLVVTDSSGKASVTATANNVAGTYLVSASVGSLATTFTLTNQLNANPNLALGRFATQSSTLPGYPGTAAPSAVDGITDGNFFNGSVATTNLELNPWWQVFLDGSAAIGSVTIYNRTDCCGSRLNDYWIFISDTFFNFNDTLATLQNRPGTFAYHQTVAPGASVTIPTPGASGQYLRIQLNGTNYLSLAEVQVFAPAAPDTANLALGQFAIQSSSAPGDTRGASAAVDGSTDGNYYNGSVTATTQEANPWWQVDLRASASLSSVSIFNRTDCCASRLADYWIFVSDTPFNPADTPANLQNRAGTFSMHQTTAPSPSVTIPIPATGRYVRIQLAGSGVLSLAEVQVMGTGGAPLSDLAAGKTVTQSSTFSGYPGAAASSAADGNLDGNFFHNSVTATNLEANPWWQVDLGSSAYISSMALWNRTDCCGERLGNYWVFISDSPFGPNDTPASLLGRPGTSGVHQQVAPGPSTDFLLGTHARYVRVQLDGPGVLSLAEVQIFGTGGVPPPADLAVNKTATQSSTLPGYPSAAASSAVDGNTDGAFFNQSVTATNSEPAPWWQVDLGQSTSIGSVAVWNRTDPCCTARLSDYWVFVSDTPFLATDTPATLQNRPGTFASHQNDAPFPSTTIPVAAQGRYVRIQLTRTNYLSLAEVQVFGQ